MRIIVACGAAPFAGNAPPEFIPALERSLQEAGHSVETLVLPYSPDVPDILDQRFAFRLIDVASRSDVLISAGTPAVVLRHERKIAWLYEWESFPSLALTPAGRRIIEAAARVDGRAIREARRVFATSAALAEHWKECCGRPVETLYANAAPASIVERLLS